MYYIGSGYTTIYNIILHSNKFKEIICLSAYIAEIKVSIKVNKNLKFVLYVNLLEYRCANDHKAKCTAISCLILNIFRV